MTDRIVDLDTIAAHVVEIASTAGVHPYSGDPVADGLIWLMDTVDALVAELRESRETVAEYQAGCTIYLHTSRTSPGSPAGRFDGENPPKATVHCLGAPEEVAGLEKVIADAKDALVENADLRRRLQSIAENIVAVEQREHELAAERDDWKTRAEWWQDVTGSIGALIAAHFALPHDVSDADRLRQIATEIRDTLGYDWMNDSITENNALANRCETADAHVAAALALHPKSPDPDEEHGLYWCQYCGDAWPCPDVRALMEDPK